MTAATDLICDWFERIARDEVPHPTGFRRRANRLVMRGLWQVVADEVYSAGSTALMRDLEAATDADLLALNRAWAAR